MATAVIGTAGHIDHGKTTLLRALTGIDADRLPEERRRGMTIDLGYAYLDLDDGTTIDFVDVPGHDRLVGNMLVGAGEIDGALLVVAADDGPRAQTLEHLELLDALAISDGIVVVTKTDLVSQDRLAQAVAKMTALLVPTSLAGSSIGAVSAASGEGLGELRAALTHTRDRIAGRPGFGEGDPRMAIDRVFAVKGRGAVVTGSLRGGPMRAGTILRLEPDGREVRIREVQVHGHPVEAADGGGRTALLLGGVEAADLRRGQVLVNGGHVQAGSRVLVALRPAVGRSPGSRPSAALPDREQLRLHVGTDQVSALVVRGPREDLLAPDGAVVALLRLARPVAIEAGDRFALRRPSPASTVAGGIVLDVDPPRGLSRRRMSAERVGRLWQTLTDRAPDDAVGRARLELHGVIVGRSTASTAVANDVDEELAARALDLVSAHHRQTPDSTGLPLPALRRDLALAARRVATVRAEPAAEIADRVIGSLVRGRRIVRDRDRVRDPSRGGAPSAEVRAAMDRLVERLSTASPWGLSGAAREAGCPPDGVRALEAEGRIVRLEDDLAWATDKYRTLVKQALAMAAQGPLTPSALRESIGASRRHTMVILEDLDRRELLRRTPDGHVLGPRALAKVRPVEPVSR